uniref:ATP-dependent RNA helicase n=1 Tax=Rhizophora mucronata TaxID=61149 RepID=A0A2P2KIS0_RHIMU
MWLCRIWVSPYCSQCKLLFGRKLLDLVLLSGTFALVHQQVKEVFAAIAPAVGLSVGLAVGQSSITEEISQLIKRPKFEAGICYDPEDHFQELQSAVDVLVATPGRLMDHINTTKGFSLEHLCYLVVDETDRLLREAYQSWLPTVLKLTHSYDDSLMHHVNSFSAFGSLKTIRGW